MNRTTRILLTFATLASIFTVVPALAVEPGFYFSTSVGHAEESPKSNGTNFAIGPPAPFGTVTGIQHIDPMSVDVDDSAVAWGVTVGYRLNPYFAAEVEYVDFGTADISDTYDLSSLLPSSGSTPIRITGPTTFTNTYSSKITGPALSVLGSVPLGKSWDVFLRGGVLFADREINIPLSTGINGTKFASTVWLAGAGVDWSFANRWSVRAEYQHTGKLSRSLLAGGTELERASLSVLFRL